MTSKVSHRILVIVLCLAFLAGCKASNQPTATPTPAGTAIPPTSTPAAAEIVWVDAQNNASDPLIAIVTQFAADNSLQYRSLAALNASDITSGTRIVVFRADPGNVSELSTSSPSVQFLILDSSSATAGGNISTVQANPADMAFMAGYITMLLSDDWRAAGLLTSDGPLGTSYTDAFTNGARYVCGQCLNYFAPLLSFPAVSSEPTTSDINTWTNDAVALGKDWLGAVFIDPAAASVPVANALSAYPVNYQSGLSVTFISTEAAAAQKDIQWDVLLSSDLAPSLKAVLPMLLAGKGGNQMNAQITLTQVTAGIVSPARLDLFNQTAADLAAGKIVPLSIP
jgi:hypothetical protein